MVRTVAVRKMYSPRAIFMIKNTPVTLCLGLLLTVSPAVSQVWNPNLANGRYKNPVIFADYSDPDVVRVGEDFYMTSSSFGFVPALPILHSRDLVNWTIINHAITKFPDSDFDVPQHGNGVWAPALRYHNGEFWIYYGDPDRGIYMVKTRNIRGSWDPPVLVKAGKGLIDPAPLWDDDGRAYLVHAFARSRSGIKHRLHVAPMSPDGTRLLDEGRLVYMDSVKHPTMEGPKFYKRDGYYYIFAPAGGVATGWQTILRSRNVYGPYEDKIVLAQGSTAINGPHQGGYVETPNGEPWFVHFQDRGPYGRIVHLQPVEWKDGWPVMGRDADGDGKGEPVLEFRKPGVGRTYPVAVPQTTDEFNGARLGPQWQWTANPRDAWYSLTASKGALRLRAQKLPAGVANLWTVPNLLLQKFPAPDFQVTTRVAFDGKTPGEKSGLLIMGLDYAYLAVQRTKDGVELVQAHAGNADKGTREEQAKPVLLTNQPVHLRVTIRNPQKHEARGQFSYSLDGKTFRNIGEPFMAREGKWVGATVGLFAVAPEAAGQTGHADFDYFRIQ